jgi:hypothetical protein
MSRLYVYGAALLAALSLTGCAGFCDRHTTECTVIAVVATGVITGAVEAHRDHHDDLNRHARHGSCGRLDDRC